jgi:hypothetical protein
VNLRGNVDRVRDDTRNQMTRLLHVVSHGHLALTEGEERRARSRLILRGLERETQITLDSLQSRERGGIGHQPAEGPLLGFPTQSGEQEVDFRRLSLEAIAMSISRNHRLSGSRSWPAPE